MEIQHFSHEHPLTLQMVNTSDFRETRCYECGKYTLDLMYSCKTCTELPEKIDCHPFHSSHALIVVFNGSSYACYNHPLTLTGNKEGKICLACEKKCSSDESYYSYNICRAFSLHTSAEGYLASLSSGTPNDASSERSVVRSARPCGRTDNVLTSLKQTKHRGIGMTQIKRKSRDPSH